MSVTGLSRSHVGKSLRALEGRADQSTRHWKFTEPLCTRGWVTANKQGTCPQGIDLLVVKELIGHKARQTDPWNRKESPEINAHGDETIFITTAKTIQWKNSIFFFLAYGVGKIGCACSVTQSCPVLCEPMDCSPPGSSGPWGFSRQEYWGEFLCLPPRDLPDPGMEPKSLMFPASAGGFFISSTTWEAQENCISTSKRMMLDPDLPSSTKINSKLYQRPQCKS